MNVFSKQSVTSELAWKLIEAATQKATSLGFAISVMVVDESGIIKAFARMDGAPLISVDAARKKAVTAVGFGMPTGDSWYSFIKDDPILNQGVQGFTDFMLLGGGSPIVLEGVVAGAIGVSGGHYKTDEQCVEAALQLLK